MPSPHTIALVAAAGALLWALPGPALLLLLTRGVDLGPRGAVATALGLGVGTSVHVLAAAIGLSAILTASATAFSLVKIAGATYLVWLGIRRIRDPRPLVDLADAAPPRDDGRAFREGLTINALNPKVAVFFVAFLPPFVDPAEPAWLQLLVLGAVVTAVLLAGDIAFALVTGSIGRSWVRRLAGTSGGQRVGRYVVGTVYVGLGVTTLLTGGRNPPGRTG